MSQVKRTRAPPSPGSLGPSFRCPSQLEVFGNVERLDVLRLHPAEVGSQPFRVGNVVRPRSLGEVAGGDPGRQIGVPGFQPMRDRADAGSVGSEARTRSVASSRSRPMCSQRPPGERSRTLPNAGKPAWEVLGPDSYGVFPCRSPRLCLRVNVALKRSKSGPTAGTLTGGVLQELLAEHQRFAFRVHYEQISATLQKVSAILWAAIGEGQRGAFLRGQKDRWAFGIHLFAACQIHSGTLIGKRVHQTAVSCAASRGRRSRGPRIPESLVTMGAVSRPSGWGAC